MMPVGDQQLGVGQFLHERARELRIQPPEARDDTTLVRLEIRLTEAVDLHDAVPEEEQRLELCARGSKQPQPALLRPGMRALVRQDDAVLVWLDPQGRNEP